MAIDSYDKYVKALPTSQRIWCAKNSYSGSSGSAWVSLWTVNPGAGTGPGTTAAICNNTTTGSLAYTAASGANTLYLTRMALSSNVQGGIAYGLADRLMHVGGLSGTVTSAQTVGLDLTNSAFNTRRGRSDYTSVQYFFEHYVSTGTTSVTATVTYTNTAGVSGQTTNLAWSSTQSAARLTPIYTLNGDVIRSIESVTLSASTGTAGNFGITAMRMLGVADISNVILPSNQDWSVLGMPPLANDCCLMLICFQNFATGTLTGALSGYFSLTEG